MLLGILLLSDTHVILELQPILLSHLMLMVFSMGIGVLNCALFGLLPVWEMVWGITMRPLMLASGVMFIYEDMPSFARAILWYNPCCM
ncbi:ABC transporter permease [Gemmobacter lanyuensis]